MYYYMFHNIYVNTKYKEIYMDNELKNELKNYFVNVVDKIANCEVSDEMSLSNIMMEVKNKIHYIKFQKAAEKFQKAVTITHYTSTPLLTHHVDEVEFKEIMENLLEEVNEYIENAYDVYMLPRCAIQRVVDILNGSEQSFEEEEDILVYHILKIIVTEHLK